MRHATNIITVYATDLREGHKFELGSETVTVHRVDPLRETHVRIIGTMGYVTTDDPHLIVSLTVPAEACLIVSARFGVWA